MHREILIIDDSREIGEALNIIMENLGYKTKYFESPIKAMKYFEDEMNPVVFLDIHLPGENGLKILEVIKKMSPFTQVIMMTGERDVEIVVDSLKSQATDFLLKPFSMNSVQNSLKRAVEQYDSTTKKYHYQDNLERDVKFISKFQRQVIYPRVKTNEFFADFYPASFVSGGFYQSYKHENGTLLIFGNVEGSGVTSGFIALMTLCLFKEIATTEVNTSVIMEKINNELYYRVNIHTLNAICINIDSTNKKIYYSPGGAPFPVFLTSGSVDLNFLESEENNILGALPDASFETLVIDYAPGDVLFLYNDGFYNYREKEIKEKFNKLLISMNKIYAEGKNSFEKIGQELEEHLKIISANEQKNDLSFLLYNL